MKYHPCGGIRNQSLIAVDDLSVLVGVGGNTAGVDQEILT